MTQAHGLGQERLFKTYALGLIAKSDQLMLFTVSAERSCGTLARFASVR